MSPMKPSQCFGRAAFEEGLLLNVLWDGGRALDLAWNGIFERASNGWSSGEAQARRVERIMFRDVSVVRLDGHEVQDAALWGRFVDEVRQAAPTILSVRCRSIEHGRRNERWVVTFFLVARGDHTLENEFVSINTAYRDGIPSLGSDGLWRYHDATTNEVFDFHDPFGFVKS